MICMCAWRSQRAHKLRPFEAFKGTTSRDFVTQKCGAFWWTYSFRNYPLWHFQNSCFNSLFPPRVLCEKSEIIYSTYGTWSYLVIQNKKQNLITLYLWVQFLWKRWNKNPKRDHLYRHLNLVRKSHSWIWNCTSCILCRVMIELSYFNNTNVYLEGYAVQQQLLPYCTFYLIYIWYTALSSPVLHIF